MEKINGWQLYNHAMIPTVAPHENVDLAPVKSGEIWKYRENSEKPLLVTWTSNWDCSQETNWWYVICEGPFNFDTLSSSSRRNIRKALRNCQVEIINPTQHSEELWRVYNEATERYENYAVHITKDEFISCCNNPSTDEEYWAGFSNDTGRMIGYAIFIIHKDWVDFHKSRYSAPFLKLRVSDAINAKALEYYLNEKKKRYISDGTRSISHKTNFQKYLIEHFGYKKSYCTLHVRYRNWVKVMIDIFYPFQRLFMKFDDFTLMHQLNSLMTLETIVRSQDS